MTGYLFRPDSSEISSFIFVDHHLVVGGLASKVLSVRVHCSSCDCVHFGFGNVFGNNWNTKLPDKQLFVIGTGNKFIVFDESDGIHSTKMLLVR